MRGTITYLIDLVCGCSLVSRRRWPNQRIDPTATVQQFCVAYHYCLKHPERLNEGASAVEILLRSCWWGTQVVEQTTIACKTYCLPVAVNWSNNHIQDSSCAPFSRNPCNGMEQTLECLVRTNLMNSSLTHQIWSDSAGAGLAGLVQWIREWTSVGLQVGCPWCRLYSLWYSVLEGAAGLEWKWRWRSSLRSM